ncbi:hypothetical protein [Telluribacter sp.]|jgi:hypothetical protein|uniref:hypothetical protein n=1 Tax=Telluribacter sp. TaxID=1978767 RepID=UPI002E0F5381|nr:hypothetical protein [Telluribacter sp.]
MKNSIKIFVCALALSTSVLGTTASYAGTISEDSTTTKTTTLVDGKANIQKAMQNLPATVPPMETPAPCKDRVVLSKKYTPEQKAAITGLQLSGQAK